MREDALQRDIRALLKDRDGLLLAHNYQQGKVQDVAYRVGDGPGPPKEATLGQWLRAGRD